MHEELTNQLHGLWDPEVQCLIHKGSPIILILNQIIQFLTLTPTSLRFILILSSHLVLGFPTIQTNRKSPRVIEHQAFNEKYFK